MDNKGEGYDILKRTQWGYASNPNMAGVLMVGLGCEVFQIGRWKEAYGIAESDTFRTMTIQDVGGTRKTVAAGVERDPRHAARPPILHARNGAGFRADARASMRRL